MSVLRQAKAPKGVARSTSADIRQRPWYPRRVDRRPRRAWAFVALALLIVACAAACVVYWFVPYEPGPRNQRWTVTVSHGGRSASSTGFGLGRCGDEGEHGATVAKRGALGRACYSAGLCPGDAVCDCASSASVRTRCEEGQVPGRTRLGDRITVPIR